MQRIIILSLLILSYAALPAVAAEEAFDTLLITSFWKKQVWLNRNSSD